MSALHRDGRSMISITHCENTELYQGVLIFLGFPIIATMLMVCYNDYQHKQRDLVPGAAERNTQGPYFSKDLAITFWPSSSQH